MSVFPTKSFGEVFSVQLGKMLDKNKNKGDLYPYLANRNVRWGRCDVSDLAEMRFTAVDRQKYELRSGDLLVCEGGEVGRTAIWEGEVAECYYQKAVHRLRPKRPVVPRFVLHYMRWAAERNVFARLTSSTSIAHLTKAKLSRATLPMPPLPEQRRIAAILDRADAIRRKRRAAIELTEDLLRSTFLDMFGDPVTNPKGWPTTTLGDQVASLKYGTSQKCSEDRMSGGLPVLRIPNISSERIDWSELKYAELDKKAAQAASLETGDLLFVRTNGNPEYIGRCAVFDGARPAAFASYLIRARFEPSATVNPAFARDQVSASSYRHRLVREARTTAGNYNINTKGLARLQLIAPPASAQARYLDRVDAIDTLKASQHAALREADTLFHALMQRAFRGDL